MISNFEIHDCGTNQPEFSSMTSWYELRADDEKVAAFGPIGRDSSTSVFKLLEDTRLELYRDKVLQVVAVRKVQSRNEKGELSFVLDGLKEEVIHEEHPTVLDIDEKASYARSPQCYDLYIL